MLKVATFLDHFLRPLVVDGGGGFFAFSFAICLKMSKVAIFCQFTQKGWLGRAS